MTRSPIPKEVGAPQCSTGCRSEARAWPLRSSPRCSRSRVERTKSNIPPRRSTPISVLSCCMTSPKGATAGATGSTSTCSGSMSPLSAFDCGQGTLICNAAPGYDGPTGVGTPNGIAAFEPGGEGKQQTEEKRRAEEKLREEEQRSEQEREERQRKEREAEEEKNKQGGNSAGNGSTSGTSGGGTSGAGASASTGASQAGRAGPSKGASSATASPQRHHRAIRLRPHPARPPRAPRHPAEGLTARVRVHAEHRGPHTRQARQADHYTRPQALANAAVLAHDRGRQGTRQRASERAPRARAGALPADAHARARSRAHADVHGRLSRRRDYNALWIV